jgi:hypothetical protein
VAVVTSAGKAFHRQPCASIAKSHDVVGLLHPTPAASQGRFLDFAAHKSSIKRFGFLFHLLRKLGDNRLYRFGWDLTRDVAEAESQYFPDADRYYQELINRKAHRVTDINGPEGVKLISSLKTDWDKPTEDAARKSVERFRIKFNLQCLTN